jgi:hypothetical protein
MLHARKIGALKVGNNTGITPRRRKKTVNVSRGTIKKLANRPEAAPLRVLQNRALLCRNKRGNNPRVCLHILHRRIAPCRTNPLSSIPAYNDDKADLERKKTLLIGQPCPVSLDEAEQVAKHWVPARTDEFELMLRHALPGPQ